MMSEDYLILYEYLDQLLRVQSTTAEMFEHKGVLGTVRENFLSQQITERIDSPLIHTGEVTFNNGKSGQLDLIIRKSGTLNPEIGGQVRIPASDCAAIIEVKSNATGSDIRAFNIKAGEIKKDNPNVICGFFTYKLACTKRYALKKFGIIYDYDILEFDIENNVSAEYNNIDFISCLDDSVELVSRRGKDYTFNKFFFLHRSKDSTDPLIEYELVLKPPFSFYFLSQIQWANSI
jgi:hypothetical protein